MLKKIFIRTLINKVLMTQCSKISIFFLFISLSIIPKLNFAQNAFEKDLKTKMDSLISDRGLIVISQSMLPNNSVSSIMTPTGWGSYGSFAFAVLGGIYPAGYTDKADLIGTAGVTFGNPMRFVNISASVNVTRVSELKDLSYNLILSKQLFKSSSVSVGGLQLFPSKLSDAPYDTYFIAFSHAVQTTPSKRPGFSALGYTIGFGTGRFLNKSPWDIDRGKGKYGTGFFASVSYEIIKQVNLNAEWSGLNLGFSTGIRPIKNNNLTFGLGVYNLTKFSGDRVGMIGTIGLPVSLDRQKLYR
jgi:hypothetical protein